MEDNNDKVLNNMKYLIQQYQAILEWMNSHLDEDGICRSTHKQMASHIDVSQAEISNIIKNLIELGCIERIKDLDVYTLRSTDLSHTPIFVLYDLAYLIKKQPNLSYAQQADILDISFTELEKAYGYLTFALS
ncbi:MarR family transcriptional regulator [Paenibacillus pini]|uniref:Uncharacterized protein n=1 Tax=Paenibacillus pini JCM 16418 TaxID=1236976 RepID=W7Z7P3_9BACL|nr:MarR family transcriptional regulator [Paenibacillus pini]GAF10424.1 hypothetical protein JCM16418_4627 [Paenibacillus pini JCM 16418]